MKIRGLELKNRLGLSPMCQYSAENGMANDWHFAHYAARAAGGLGLEIVEAAAVSPEGRISPQDLGIWDDSQIGGLARIASFAKTQKCATAIQIAHAGRKASCAADFLGGRPLEPQDGGWSPIAPSPLPFHPGHPVPREMDASDIKKAVEDFANAAGRAVEAGFDIVEIHAAHGYLIHEFLSPITNLRKDEYGGSFENRSRFAVEVARAVRAAIPDGMPLFARISATDWVDGGWNITESAALAVLLKNEGVDLIDVSSGGLVENAAIPVGCGYQVPFAHAIRRDARMPTAAVGLITEAAQAETILSNAQADIILLGRELLRNPSFAFQAAARLGAEIEYPVQYARAKIRR